jgi:hypothetical protein
MKVALDRVAIDSTISRQQKLTLTMSVRNLLESFEDKERVSKIQGLINEMMTFMGDDMAMITGPYDELLSLDDVIDEGLILFMSSNVNVNERAVTALGRMLLQNLQLMIGRRYSLAEEGEHQPLVSVIMDEFSPFAPWTEPFDAHLPSGTNILSARCHPGLASSSQSGTD